MKILGNPPHTVHAVDNPTPIMQAIPECKYAFAEGKHIVAVPYTVEYTHIIKQFGLKTYSPILHRYNFPGRYTPFEHQRDTARFLTENRRAYVLNGLGCIEGDAIISTNRLKATRKITLRKLYERWSNPRTGAFGNEHWKCRSLKDGFFGLNQIEDVVFKGYKQTLKITLADGKVLRCTPDHNLAQIDGSWLEAGEAKVGDLLVTNGAKAYRCPQCGEVRIRKTQPRTPTQICISCKYKNQLGQNSGDKNPAWNGGKFIDCDGYVKIYAPDHHRAVTQCHVYEHIIVAEKLVGHPITKDYQVHHINGVKHDNRPENLRVMSITEHHSHHAAVHHLDGGRTINGGTVVIIPKTSPIVSIEDGGVTDVYDICMKAPHHNFVANGIVVHNSGKTNSAMWAADFLMKEGVIRRCLIVAPLSCLERVWGDTLYQNFPNRRFVVLHGTRQTRLDLLKQNWDFAIINHHGLGIIREHLPKDVDLIIIDELATMRSHKAKTLFGEAKKTIQPHHWVWGLTGSPTPNAPTDAYALSKLVTPERYNGSFTRFKADSMLQISPFRFIPRRNAEQLVNQILQPSIRYATEDCVDIPETIYHERTCELSSEQMTHYLKLKRECMTEIRGTEVTAVNAAVLVSKLLQVSLGCLYGADNETVELDFGPRLSVLKDCIEEAGGKIIIFAPFTAVIKNLERKLKKEYTVETVMGSTSAGKRNQIFSDFNEKDSPQIIIAAPQCMSHGLNLHHRCSSIAWFSGIWSYEFFCQANARTARPGQKHKTNIFLISGSPVENRIYQVLREKGKFSDMVLQMAKEEGK